MKHIVLGQLAKSELQTVPESFILSCRGSLQSSSIKPYSLHHSLRGRARRMDGFPFEGNIPLLLFFLASYLSGFSAVCAFFLFPYLVYNLELDYFFNFVCFDLVVN